MSWNTAVPSGTDLVRDGDDVIREFKVDVQAALRATEGAPLSQDAGAFPGATPATPKFHYRGLKGTTANIPAATNYGLYWDTTIDALKRSNGTTWEIIAIGTNYSGAGGSFPAGTKVPFYQAVAPLGWTLDASVNDRFIRISSSAGGVTGGTFTSMSHNHTMSNHTHDEGDLTARIGWGLAESVNDARMFMVRQTTSAWGSSPLSGNPGDNYVGGSGIGAETISITHGAAVFGDSGTPSTNNTSSATLDHGSAQHGYADFIICTKN